MSWEYDNYLEEHINNVRKAFEWIKDKIPDICSDDDWVTTSICVSNHDLSKYSEDEYDAYDKYFYGNNKSYAVLEEFKYAWLYHIQDNPHHWQHYVLVNDDPEEGITALDMPIRYIIEMICDWWSFSWKSDNLYEIFNWYEQRKDYIKLSDNTRRIVEDILTKIKKVLDSERSDNDTV